MRISDWSSDVCSSDLVDGAEPGIFAEAEEALTLAQADAVVRFLDEHGIARNSVRVIGFHGQTVLHQATDNGRKGNTRQLGNGRLMADRTGIDVVYDFRTDDKIGRASCRERVCQYV